MLLDQSSTNEATWLGESSGGSCGDGAAGEATRCEQIHRRLKRIVKARGALDAQEAAALREAQQQRVWRHYGYASLVEYMEIEMGYSPRVAIERLRVAKAIEELPVIAEALTQGGLSFSAAKEITRVATPETEHAWVDAVSEKNVREVEELVSGHAKGDTPEDPPDPKLRTRVLRYEVLAETAGLERQVRRALEQRCGERLDPNAFVSAMFRFVLENVAVASTGVSASTGTHGGAISGELAIASTGAPDERSACERDREGQDGGVDRARYQVGVVYCRGCGRGWQDSGGSTVEMTPAALETALCDAQHVGDLDTATIERAKQDVPPATRRKVKRRDHGSCRVPGCRSATNLDIHHIVPREKGGTHEMENLITLCESHHLAHHAGALIIEGRASSPTIVRRAHNAFTMAQRAIETGVALKQLGYDKRQAKAAVEKTRAHVGTTELSLEQWIKIALRYCSSS